MRKKDREITDPQIIYSVLESCQCCRIGFYDSGEIYIVPLNFGFEFNDDRLVFYFHGAKEGRKIHLIEKNPQVGFEMDANYEVYSKYDSGTACDYTARFQSIIGTGKICVVNDPDEKQHGLILLMKHIEQKDVWSFDEKILNAVAVFKLEVEKLSCKIHK